MKDLTKEQLLEMLAEKDHELEQLKSSSGETMPVKVLKLIEAGYRTIEELAEELETNNRNISSNLTYIRKDHLLPKGLWLVSAKIKGQTYVHIIDLKEFGWL